MAISAINLGNTFTNVDGTTVTSGLASGLNTSAIINSLVSAQSAQITQLQDQVTVQNSETSALNTLNSLLTNLQTDTTALSEPQSPDSTTNVFAQRSTSITGNTTQAASNYLTATASTLATTGTYTISDISQIATNTIQESNGFNIASPSSSVVASTPTTGMFSAGTFYINGQAVTLTAGESLTDVAAAFNAANSATPSSGISASVLETAPGTYNLVFTGANTGLANAFNLNTTMTTNVISVSSPTAATSGQIAAGTYTVNGQSITISADESLSDIAAAFTESGAGITATVVNTGTGEYQIQFTGDTSGLNNSTNASGLDLITTATNTIDVASGDAATSGQIAAGTYTVNGQSVTLTANESLNNIAAAFNNADAGITATVVNVGSGQYQIQFTGNTSTLNSNATNLDLGTMTSVTGDTSGALSNITLTTVQAAQDAKFVFNGVVVDRPTNTISDLVSGVTFNLLQNTASQPDASFTINVTPNTNGIEDAVANFVNNYNSFLTFYAEQTATDSSTGAPLSTAVLHSDNTLESIYNQLSSYAASVVSGLSSGSSTLQDLGISFTNQAATSTTPAVANMLTIDSSTLSNAITNNLSSVEQVLGYNATTSTPDLEVYSGPKNQSISNFTVNVDQTTTPPTYTAVYTDSTGQQQTVDLTQSSLSSGMSLTAPASSGLNGLILIYSGPATSTGMTVSTTNGIASMMNSLVTSATATSTGLIAVDQKAIATQTTATQTQITNVNSQISTMRQQLLTKFSALESAIESANSTLNYLNAQQNAISAQAG